MQFNQKFIKLLAAGEIALYNEPKNPETALEIIVATGKDRIWLDGQSPYYYKGISEMMYGCDRLDLLPKLPIIPIADFLLPEPRFKVGDWVRLSSGLKKEYKVLSFEFDDDVQLYFYKLSGCELMEAEIELVTGNINESPTKCGSEKQFEIGKCYEFSDGEDWVKGKAIGTVDYEGQRNFIADIGGKLSVFENIRPIQPKEITRWINMSQSGNQVGKKCFESEIEACQHAPQSQNVFQVKLTGTYTI